MRTPDNFPEIDLDQSKINALESRIRKLMQSVAFKFSGKVKSVQLMIDDNFVHRRDRTTNDYHLLLELKGGGYFHLRAYTRHMLDTVSVDTDRVFLTGYIEPQIMHHGGTHSLRQDWYPWDADTIANEVISQNPRLFLDEQA